MKSAAKAQWISVLAFCLGMSGACFAEDVKTEARLPGEFCARWVVRFAQPDLFSMATVTITSNTFATWSNHAGDPIESVSRNADDSYRIVAGKKPYVLALSQSNRMLLLKSYSTVKDENGGETEQLVSKDYFVRAFSDDVLEWQPVPQVFKYSVFVGDGDVPDEQPLRRAIHPVARSSKSDPCIEIDPPGFNLFLLKYGNLSIECAKAEQTELLAKTIASRNTNDPPIRRSDEPALGPNRFPPPGK